MVAETAEEMAKRYRRMAEETRRLAQRSNDPDFAAAYEDLAARWETLAGGVAYGMNWAANDQPRIVNLDCANEDSSREA